ncbi:Hypothetical protein NGAL_HAMBI2605_45930 [Neorhizobium galegae bv. orientalis]|nr:Hypothetical protein NGAL_HAMBI2605_45930 [Neorhizobium galegae bv. orientalis]
MLTFKAFKGPAAMVCIKTGLRIDKAINWGGFTDLFQEMDARRGGKLPDQFLALPASTGETALIQAILHAADYSQHADRMEGSGTWKRLDYVTGIHAQAVAAAIVRQD